MGYICRVRLTALAALLIALAVSGCGSSGESKTTTAPAGAGGPTPTGSSESAADGKSPRASGKKWKQTTKAGSQGAGGGGGKSSRKQGSSTAKGNPSSTRVKRKLAKYCPKGMNRGACRAYIEGSAKTKGAPGSQISGPRDCTKVMSRAECEEVLSQQSQAGEEGSSVNVEQCMAHPTPHCEEVLREEIERQQAAQQAGG